MWVGLNLAIELHNIPARKAKFTQTDEESMHFKRVPPEGVSQLLSADF